MAQLVILADGGTNFLVIVGILLGVFWIYKSQQTKIEWFSQHIIPENPRTDRNISEDVLVFDYDNDCNIIAYYQYGTEQNNWVFMGNVEIPKNFKWRYFDIDIDEP